jgi:hypothetical protein
MTKATDSDAEVRNRTLLGNTDRWQITRAGGAAQPRHETQSDPMKTV